jgi:hypothetical protein
VFCCFPVEINVGFFEVFTMEILPQQIVNYWELLIMRCLLVELSVNAPLGQTKSIYVCGHQKPTSAICMPNNFEKLILTFSSKWKCSDSTFFMTLVLSCDHVDINFVNSGFDCLPGFFVWL